jgi:hypothetical protein
LLFRKFFREQNSVTWGFGIFLWASTYKYAAGIPCNSDLMKKKPINRGFVSSTYGNCVSPQLGSVRKLNSDDTTGLLNVELDVIECPDSKKRQITKSEPNVERKNSNTNEWGVNVHGKDTVGLTNQAHPQYLNCELRQTQGVDLVLDAFVGLNQSVCPKQRRKIT